RHSELCAGADEQDLQSLHPERHHRGTTGESQPDAVQPDRWRNPGSGSQGRSHDHGQRLTADLRVAVGPGQPSPRSGSGSPALRAKLLGSSRRRLMTPDVRLTEPMVREAGKLRRASWDEALNRAAEGFRRSRDEHGPESFGMFSCSKATNEVNYLAEKFARLAIGSNNV